MFNCPQCEYSHEKLISLSLHFRRTHKSTSKQLYLELYCNNIEPTCACGCNSPVLFHTIKTGFSEYAWGHASRVHNNWGHNEIAHQHSKEGLIKAHKEGRITVWNAGLTKETDERVAAYTEKINTPERADKISKALTGKQKSEAHVEKITKHMQEFWSSEENREKQSQTRLKYMQTTDSWKCYGTVHKRTLNNKNILLKSNYELAAFNHFSNDNNIAFFDYETIKIKYRKYKTYLVDFIIIQKNGIKKLIEIKAEFYCNDDLCDDKFTAARKFAEENDYTFEVWTEKTHPFLTNGR